VKKAKTYEGKSRGSESRCEPALLDPSLPPDILYAFLAGEDEGKCAGLDDEPADIRVVNYNDPTNQRCIYTHAQTKAARFFSGCYASQLHGVRPRRVVVCRLVLREFLREIEDLHWQRVLGSSTGQHQVAWVSGEVHRQ
jgi:hypothetical protein